MPTLTLAPGEIDANPFGDLIPDSGLVSGQELIGGGTDAAPAFQRNADGSTEMVARALPVAPPDFGPFSDLVSATRASAPADLGLFSDLIPVTPTSEAEAALAETPKAEVLIPSISGEYAPAGMTAEDEAKAIQGAPDWLQKASTALVNTAKGFVPTTVGQAVDMLTPWGSVKDGYEKFKVFKDVLSGVPLPEAMREHIPLAREMSDAEKTPPWSQERWNAGFNLLGQLGMSAMMVKGIKKQMADHSPGASPESVSRQSGEVPATPEAPLSPGGRAPSQDLRRVAESPDPASPSTEQSSPAQPLTSTEPTTVPFTDKTVLPPDANASRPTSSETIATAEGSAVLGKGDAKIAQTPSTENVARPVDSTADVAAAPERAPVNDWTEATIGLLPPGSVHLQEAMEGFGKAMKIRKRTHLDATTTQRSAKLQKSFSDAELVQRDIKKVAPTERRQGAISVWMEANGDVAKLDQWAAAAKGKVFRQAAQDAKALTPDELAVAQKARATFDILEQRGTKYDVLTAHRDNYVPHVWEVEKRGSGIGSSRLQDKFKFNKARTFDTFFDGDQAGFKPKTLAIGKILPAYLHEMNKVIADRQFIQEAQGGLASDGRPLFIPRGRVSEIDTSSGGKAYLADPGGMKGMKDAAGDPIDQSGYKVLNEQPALKDWRWEGKDAEGNPIFMKDDLAVHPEMQKRLRAMMGRSAIKEWYSEPATGLSVIPRAIAKNIDVAQSVMKREMFGLLAPFHQVQEGTHGVGHTVNPFGGMRDMSRMTPEMIDGARHGLMLQPDSASSTVYMEGVGAKSTFISQVARKFGSAPGRAIADVIDGYQHYLFHHYIPALKFKTYEHALERNLKRYEKDITKGEVTPADVKMLTAEQVNGAYGHLNYALLDRNPTMQHFMQLTLLAPDFLEARARLVGQAAKSLTGSKAGREQFRAIAVLAGVQAGSAYVISQLLGDEWDPHKPFEVTHGGRTYMLRSVPEDLARLFFEGPDTSREFVSARINPLLQKVDQMRTGINYRGEKTDFLDTVGELLLGYIPITARSIPWVRDLTETTARNPVSPLEQLAGSLGIKVSRYSPITKTYQLASEWKKANGLEADKGSYPVSKYQKLRYALEDNDLDRAKTERQKLLDSGMSTADLSDGFKSSLHHAFTGSSATDREFRDSLDDEQRAMYDLAVQRRRDIWHRFQSPDIR